jgi:hypothetical protein
MVDSDIVLLYIWSRVLGIIYVVGLGVVTVQTPSEAFSLDRAIDEVSGTLPMHMVSPGIWIVCGTRRSDSLVRAS